MPLNPTIPRLDALHSYWPLHSSSDLTDHFGSEDWTAAGSGPNTETDGYLYGAINFNSGGSTSNADTLEQGDMGVLDGGEWTVCGWFRSAGQSNSTDGLIFGTDDGLDGIYLDASSERVNWRLNNTERITGAETFTLDEWQFVAMRHQTGPVAELIVGFDGGPLTSEGTNNSGTPGTGGGNDVMGAKSDNTVAATDMDACEWYALDAKLTMSELRAMYGITRRHIPLTM